MNLKHVCAIVSLSIMAALAFVAVGLPRGMSKSQILSLAFPRAVAINLVNRDEIEIPRKLNTLVRYEVYNEELKNIKLESKAARLFSRLAGKLVEKSDQKLVFAVNKKLAVAGRVDFDFISLFNDGSLIVQNSKEREKGILRPALYNFDSSYFNSPEKIKELAFKQYVQLTSDKKKIVILDRSRPITIAFFDQSGNAYPIATEVLANDRVMILGKAEETA